MVELTDAEWGQLEGQLIHKPYSLPIKSVIEYCESLRDEVESRNARIEEYEAHLRKLWSVLPENPAKLCMSDFIRFLMEELKELREAQRWRKIEDELPEEDTDVLTYPGPKRGWYNGEAWCIEQRYGTREVTHWMPLPGPPKEES